jgi:hypothetical protein
MDDILGESAREALQETRRQCTATSKTTGERCGRAPILGGFVCINHGGGQQATIQAARRRMLALVDPAMDVLQRVMTSNPPCPACGRSDEAAVQVRAAQIVLDRTGFHASVDVNVGTNDAPPWAKYLTDEQLLQFASWIAEAKVRMAQQAIDGVLVETETTSPGAGLNPTGNGSPEGGAGG